MSTVERTSAAPTWIGWLGQAFIPAKAGRDYPLGYYPALDGSRGLMTLGVLMAHTRPLLMPGAIVFMDIFFTMSGYLITSILLSSYRKHGRIDFKKFYIRRFLRLFPALAMLVVGFLIVTRLFSTEFDLRLTEALTTFFYISNYYQAISGQGFPYLGHTWSLSVEEQYYLIWPAFMLLLLKCFGVSWRAVIAILVAAAGFAVWRAYLVATCNSFDWVYAAFDTRADSLLVGCALAFALKLIDWNALPTLKRWFGMSLLPLLLYGIACGLFIRSDMPWYWTYSFLFGSLPAAIAVIALVIGPRTIVHSLYELPVLVFIGRICYGLYLVHFPVFQALRQVFHLPYIGVFLIGWPIAFGLATASYFLVERHFMKSRPL